jgi:macrolide-specific efflux system membrane fusion protein
MTKRLVVFALLIAATVTTAVFLFRSPPAAPDNRDWPTLQTTRGTLQDSIVAVGTVKPDVGGQVKVGSQISGIVERLMVNVGDMVEKGDVLAVLDTTERRARIDAIEADLIAARAEHAYAKAQLARYEGLDDVSRNQVDGFRRDAEVKLAAIRRAEAQLRQARIELGYATISAPISGMIESVSTYQGETVAASFAAPTFVTIVDLQRLQIECFVDESNIGRISAGQQVDFTVDAYPSEPQKGVVRAILPKAQLLNSVVNYIVIVEILSKKALPLRPEMTARVNFVLSSRTGIIVLPRSALVRESGGAYVFVGKGGEWEKRKVRTGSSTSQQIEISSGLGIGETVLVDAQRWIAERGGKGDD